MWNEEREHRGNGDRTENTKEKYFLRVWKEMTTLTKIPQPHVHTLALLFHVQSQFQVGLRLSWGEENRGGHTHFRGSVPWRGCSSVVSSPPDIPLMLCVAGLPELLILCSRRYGRSHYWYKSSSTAITDIHWLLFNDSYSFFIQHTCITVPFCTRHCIRQGRGGYKREPTLVSILECHIMRNEASR